MNLDEVRARRHRQVAAEAEAASGLTGDALVAHLVRERDYARYQHDQMRLLAVDANERWRRLGKLLHRNGRRDPEVLDAYDQPPVSAMSRRDRRRMAEGITS